MEIEYIRWNYTPGTYAGPGEDYMEARVGKSQWVTEPKTTVKTINEVGEGRFWEVCFDNGDILQVFNPFEVYYKKKKH